MIVSRRPWLLYDVDVVGAALVLALALLGAWLIVIPWQHTWVEYHRVTAARGEAAQRLNAEVVQLDQLRAELAPLTATLRAQVQSIPSADALSGLLQQMTELARACNLELREVAPQPTCAAGSYLVSDIQIGGRGRSADFFRFLDQLSQLNPFQTLRTCTINRPATSTQPACDFAWTVRFYLLPPEATTRPEGAP